MDKTSKAKWITNERARQNEDQKATVDFLSKKETADVRAFHESFPQYAVTPLWDLKNLAKEWNLGSVLVKDESYRFGLNAFKVLGGSYAIGRQLCESNGIDIKQMNYQKLISDEMKEIFGKKLFVTATDGNHGRGVAWSARELGHRSVVFMPKGSAQMRLENIKREGADASITELNYDDTVRYANKYAKANDGIVVQDSSWEGYQDIPSWIMKGYTTIAVEIDAQIDGEGGKKPTHVFLQAGVGSYAAAIQGYLLAEYGEDRPISIIVEPDVADCFYRSMEKNDGKPYAVTGSMDTIMAGLACGEPNPVAWEITRDYSDFFVSCKDSISATGMRILANPIKDDPKVVSGESGAVGIGLLALITRDPKYAELKEAMKLDHNSRVLIISTEGDTDVQGYRRIVWDGAYPNE